MRMRLGRPDLDAYAARFDVPAAAGDVSVTFLGVSGLLFDDGTSAVMTDGYFSRPPLVRVVLGKVAPDVARVGSALARLGLDDGDGGRGLDAVVPVHTHLDHVMDSAVVARRTGAVLVGGESAANVGRGAGLAEDRIRVVIPQEPVSYGAFTLTFVRSVHCPPDRFPGAITEPLVPPAKAAAYRCGEAWSVLVEHSSGRTALVQGSAGFVPGALDGWRADVAYLGVGQLGLQAEEYVSTGSRPCRRWALAGWSSSTGTTSSAPSTSRCAHCRSPATTSTSPCGSSPRLPTTSRSPSTCPRCGAAKTPGRAWIDSHETA
jgi:L-ascorbate metabolism protein UlaG (beta-lactamase superfamily)